MTVVGYASLDIFESGVRKAFSTWKARISGVVGPVVGTPSHPTSSVATVEDPQAPATLQLSFVSPHDDAPWTIARQQAQFTDMVDLALLNRRFATEVQAGGSLLSAAAVSSAQRRVEDQIVIAALPVAGSWRKALDQIWGRYAPFAVHTQSLYPASYGAFSIGAQVQTSRMHEFASTLDEVLNDMANRGPTPDELDCAKATSVSTAERIRNTNAYWLASLHAYLGDRNRLTAWMRCDAMRAFISSRSAVTATQIRNCVKQYLIARPSTNI